MTVWAFAKVDDSEARALVYDSIRHGKSRFGWSQRDEHNLRRDGWSDWHSKQMFLLQIRPEDWIVHVNCPEWGRCVAVQSVGEYEFDDGVPCEWGPDFRHGIPVNPDTIVEFDRRDQNILPTINLNPRQRYHRIYAIEDFLQSLENLRSGAVSLRDEETRELFHLRDKTKALLSQITTLIQQTHRGKSLERLFAKVFRRVPGVVDVAENGFGWGTDHGADLVVTMQASIANISFEQRVIVQIKSFGGSHYDLSAIEQVEEGIAKFDAVAGIIITTAKKTEYLESAIQSASERIGKPIDLLAGDDVAKFALQHAQDLVFELKNGS